MAETARRQRLSAEERREQLMAAVVEVLAAHGYRGASADAIARRAGVSKGLLWHYFADLDELFEMTAHRTLNLLRSTVGSTLDLDAPTPDVIRTAIRRAAALGRTHGKERRAIGEIVVNLRNADGSLRLGLQDYEEMTELRKPSSGGARPTATFVPRRPRLLAVTYQGAVDAMLGYLDSHPDIDADDYAATVAAVLLDGIVAP